MSTKALKYIIFTIMAALWAMMLASCAGPRSAGQVRHSPKKEGHATSATKKRGADGLFALSAKGRSSKVSRGSSLPCPDFRRTDMRPQGNRPKRPVYVSGMPDDEPVAQQPRQETLPDPTTPKPGTAKLRYPTPEVEKLTTTTAKPPKPVLNPLYFVFDEDELTAEDWQTIRTAAEYVQYGYRIVVEGHTDNYGSEEYNSLLSLKRAQRIKQLMVERAGVPADRVAVLALGETQPVTTNDTPENRQRNRRVEIRVVE
jgi:peptidoglycan-associated lipoprotein